MEDYYSKVNELPEDKLIAEIERLNKQLFKINATSPIYNQLIDMINIANNAYDELSYKKRVKVEDKVIEIGTVEQETFTPDYSKEVLLNAVVQQYRKGVKK
jgi:hypothetical protein